MQPLASLRNVWKLVQEEEIKLSSSLTIQESVDQFLALYRTFAPDLKKTESLFRPDREAYLSEFQHRLQRIAEWQKEHG